MKKLLLYSAIPLAALAAITFSSVNNVDADEYDRCGCGCETQNYGCRNGPSNQCQIQSENGF